MKLSRRFFLRGATGLVIGLPFLEARAQALPKRRFIGLYYPNGVHTPQWFPTAGATEYDFTLGSLHAPLLPWKEQLLMTGGIDLSVAVSGPGEQHQRGVGAFLTGAKLGQGDFVGNDGTRAGYALGPSIDQTLVPLLSGGTAIPSLQLGVRALLPNVSGVVSYRDVNEPLLPQNNPHLTFRTLFTDALTPPDELLKLRARRKSVLDTVKSQLGHLKQQVSAFDLKRLDAHLEYVRDLEKRLTTMPPSTCEAPLDPGPMEFEREAEFGAVAQLQLDLLALAMRCDLTRVATVMFSDAQNHTTLPHLDITSDVHNLTHLADQDQGRQAVAVRDVWQSAQLAHLMEALNTIDDAAGGTALDHTLIFQGSDVSRGNTHAHDDMPFILAGGGAGFRMGRYVRFGGVTHNRLLVSILQGFGSDLEGYGAEEFSGEPLANLT